MLQLAAIGGSSMDEDFCDLVRLIRSLQRLEGNPECFGREEISCKYTLCAWRDYCQHPESEPLRCRDGDAGKNDQ